MDRFNVAWHLRSLREVHCSVPYMIYRFLVSLSINWHCHLLCFIWLVKLNKLSGEWCFIDKEGTNRWVRHRADGEALSNHEFASKVWSRIASKVSSIRDSSGGQEAPDDSMPKRCQTTRGASSARKSTEQWGEGLAARRTPSGSAVI